MTAPTTKRIVAAGLLVLVVLGGWATWQYFTQPGRLLSHVVAYFRSTRIVDAFYPPQFVPPTLISQAEMDARMDAGRDTLALNSPLGFQRDVLAGRSPALQFNIDAFLQGRR